MGTEEKGTAGVRRGSVWEVGQRGSTRDKHYLGSHKDSLVRVARREEGSGRRGVGRECPAQEGRAGARDGGQEDGTGSRRRAAVLGSPKPLCTSRALLQGSPKLEDLSAFNQDPALGVREYA